MKWTRLPVHKQAGFGGRLRQRAPVLTVDFESKCSLRDEEYEWWVGREVGRYMQRYILTYYKGGGSTSRNSPLEEQHRPVVCVCKASQVLTRWRD